MTRDTLINLIYARLIAPYGEYLTPGTAQQFRIMAGLLADDEQARVDAEVQRRPQAAQRRETIRELAKLPLRDRIRTLVREQEAG